MFRYTKNLLNSTAYALPQIVKNRIPAVGALVEQFTDKYQRDTMIDALRETRSIIKEDVFGLMKKGLDNASKELKSGKMYQTKEEEMDSFSESMGFDMSSFDNSFLDDMGSDNSEGGSSASELTSAVGNAAAYGAATGVQAVAASLADSPSMKATAEASYATARFARAGIGANIAMGNAIRGAVMANAQVLTEMRHFQTSVQQSYYHKQLEHSMAMATMTSEMVNSIKELRGLMSISATAGDQLMQSITNRTSDYNNVFDPSKGFDANAYLSVMNHRLKQAVGDGSMFKMIAGPLVAAPLSKALGAAVESILLPDVVKKQMAQFNDFTSKIGEMFNERATHLSAKLKKKGDVNEALGKVLDFFTISGGSSASGPDFSKSIKNKAVSFDGYAHRSLVEIIPSYLADIHSELVATRKALGGTDPGDRKLYDFKTGRFVSQKALKANYERANERESLNHFDRVRQVIGDDNDKNTANDLQSVFKTLRDEKFSIDKGNSDSLHEQLTSLSSSLRSKGRTKEADALDRQAKRISDARAKHGSRMSAELQNAITRSNAVQTRLYNNLETEEGAHRMMYSGDIYDTETRRNSVHGLAITGGKNIDASTGKQHVIPGMNRKVNKAATADISNDSVYAVGDSKGFEEGYRNKSVFRDDNGKVTIRTILQAPAAIASKAMDAFETKVSDTLFGNDGKPGIFEKVKEFFVASPDANGKHGGLFGDMYDQIKANVFDPIKNAFVGNDKDPKSKENSIFGTAKRWTKDAKDGIASYLFGTKEFDTNGLASRKGGLFGGVVNFLAGKNRQLKDYLFGKGGEGEKLGVLTNLQEKLKSVSDRLSKSIFGSIDADGRRSGGLFGNTIQGGKDVIHNLWTSFQEQAVKPLGVALFGQVVDGKRSGGLLGSGIQKGKDYLSKLKDDTTKFVFAPMREALFGQGTKTIGADGSVKFDKRGIFPDRKSVV